MSLDVRIKTVENLAKRKVERARTILETLDNHTKELSQPSTMFDLENPLHRMKDETIVGHKAFVDFAMFGADNFILWARFRFGNRAKTKKPTEIDKQILEMKVSERLGETMDWLPLCTFDRCQAWYKKFLWRHRLQRWSDICMSKLIEKKKEVDVDAKIAMQIKMHEDLKQGVLAAAREATRRLVEDMKNDPKFRLSVKELVSLGRYAEENNKVINPEEVGPIKDKKGQTLIQNNYNFGDLASVVADSIRDIK